MTDGISSGRRIAKTLAATITPGLAFPMAGAHARDASSKPIRMGCCLLGPVSRRFFTFCFGPLLS
jgi:hypothetical protein